MKFIISLCDYNVAFLLKAYKRYCLQRGTLFAQMALVNLLWREIRINIGYILCTRCWTLCSTDTISVNTLLVFLCVCVCVFKLLLYFQCSLVKKRTVLLHSYSYYAVFMGSSLLKTFLK